MLCAPARSRGLPRIPRIPGRPCCCSKDSCSEQPGKEEDRPRQQRGRGLRKLFRAERHRKGQSCKPRMMLRNELAVFSKEGGSRHFARKLEAKLESRLTRGKQFNMELLEQPSRQTTQPSYKTTLTRAKDQKLRVAVCGPEILSCVRI